MDMQKNALGIPNPAPGSQTDKRTPDRETETTRVYDIDTGRETISRRAASTLNEMYRQSQRTDPTQNNRARNTVLSSAQTLLAPFPADSTRVNIPSTIDADVANSAAAQNAINKALGG